jgi:GxxExxY protein
MAELLYKDEVYAIIGAAMEVYNTQGPGFVEPIYQEAFGMEMVARAIPVKPQQELIILYKGKPLQKTYVADYVAYEKIVIEIKALDHLGTHEEAQLLNYLKATNSPLGLLINFGPMNDLEWKRMAATRYRHSQVHHPSKIIRED